MSENVIYDKSTLVQVIVVIVRQQAITWGNADPDPCRHMASIGHIDLNGIFLI